MYYDVTGYTAAFMFYYTPLSHFRGAAVDSLAAHRHVVKDFCANRSILITSQLEVV